MAISFVGSKTFTHNSTSPQSVSLTDLKDTSNANATLQQNDIVIIAVNYASTFNALQSELTCKDPSAADYQLPHTDLYGNDTRDTNLQVQYKVMGATPDTTVTIPAVSNTVYSMACTIHAFRGVDTSNPMDVTPVTATGTNGSQADADVITPATAGAWIVICGGAAVSDGESVTLNRPSGTDATFNYYRLAAETGGVNAEARVATAIYSGWTSGAYNPAAFTVSSGSTTSHSWAAVTLALRPGATSYNLPASSGSFALSGTAANLKAGLKLPASAGSFALSGTAASLKAGLKLTAAGGSFALSGTAASFRYSRVMPSASGSFALTGTDTVLAKDTRMAADSGVFALTGTDVSFRLGKVMMASAGAFSLTGSDVTFPLGRVMVAGGGAFSLSGTAASFVYSRILAASPGSFLLTGGSVRFAYSGDDIVTSWSVRAVGPEVSLWVDALIDPPVAEWSAAAVAAPVSAWADGTIAAPVTGWAANDVEPPVSGWVDAAA